MIPLESLTSVLELEVVVLNTCFPKILNTSRLACSLFNPVIFKVLLEEENTFMGFVLKPSVLKGSLGVSTPFIEIYPSLVPVGGRLGFPPKGLVFPHKAIEPSFFKAAKALCVL